MRQRHSKHAGILKNLNWSEPQVHETSLGTTLTRTAPVHGPHKNAAFKHWKANKAELSKAGYELTPEYGIWIIKQVTVERATKTALKQRLNQYLETRPWFPTPRTGLISSVPTEDVPAVRKAYQQLRKEMNQEGVQLRSFTPGRWSFQRNPERRQQA